MWGALITIPAAQRVWFEKPGNLEIGSQKQGAATGGRPYRPCAITYLTQVVTYKSLHPDPRISPDSLVTSNLSYLGAGSPEM